MSLILLDQSYDIRLLQWQEISLEGYEYLPKTIAAKPGSVCVVRGMCCICIPVMFIHYEYLIKIYRAPDTWTLGSIWNWNRRCCRKTVHVSYFHISVSAPRNPFYYRGFILIPTGISNYLRYKVCDEIIYPFPNFSGTTICFSEMGPSWLLSCSWLLMSDRILNSTSSVFDLRCGLLDSIIDCNSSRCNVKNTWLTLVDKLLNQPFSFLYFFNAMDPSLFCRFQCVDLTIYDIENKIPNELVEI